MIKTGKIALIIVLIVVLIGLSFLIPLIDNQKPKLEKPANLAINNDVLSWNTVENADSYLVDIDGTQHQADVNNYSLATLIVTKTYTIKVIAVAKSNSIYKNSNPSEPIQHTVSLFNESSDIHTDLENGIISADEYIMQLIYAQFDSFRLDEKYKSTFEGFTTSLHIEEEILELIDELSDEVLQYYFETVNLSNVTFNYEGISTFSSSRSAGAAPRAGAGVNLGNAVISENNRFVIWYTKTGDNAITDTVAESIAAKLESTTIFYQDFFGKSYHYSSNDAAFGSGSKRDTMKETLTSLGIGANYLDDAMQVYIVNYRNESLAYYSEMGGLLKNAITGIAGMYADAMVTFPHIVIGADSVKDGLNADLEQIINHEFFHHWQTFLKSGERNLFMSDATAHWAAANASDYSNTDGVINMHAGWMCRTTHAAFKAENFKKYFLHFRYSFFTYLDAYEKNVSGGRQKIIDALYIKDTSFVDGLLNSVIKNHKNVMQAYKVFEYLETNSTKAERENLMKYWAQRTLQQDYTNKNFTVGGIGADVVAPFELGWSQGQDSYSFEGTAKAAMLYYKITESKKFTVDISIGAASSNLNAVVISQIGTTFTLIDTHTASIKFDYKPRSGETWWIVVVNTSLTEDNKPHAISVEQAIDDEENETEDLRSALLATLAELSNFPDANIAVDNSFGHSFKIVGRYAWEENILFDEIYYYLEGDGTLLRWFPDPYEFWQEITTTTYSSWIDVIERYHIGSAGETITFLNWVLDAVEDFSSAYDSELGCNVWTISSWHPHLQNAKLIIENGRISMTQTVSGTTTFTYGGQVILIQSP